MADQERKVERETILDASAREVWAALTDERLLAEWLADEVELDPEPGGRASFRFAGGEKRLGTVLSVEEERALAFTWARPGEAETEVCLRLEPLVVGTRLVVTERATTATSIAGSEAAWKGRLEALRRAIALVYA
jgi:uncharacterized protein YndB with AHSA1/START domain